MTSGREKKEGKGRLSQTRDKVDKEDVREGDERLA